jgi:hypothetical protein
MRTTVKQGAFARVLVGAVLSFEPAVAQTHYDIGDFAGVDEKMSGSEQYGHARRHSFRPFYQGPAYSYNYGLFWGHYDHEFGPGLGFWGPSVRVRY